MVLILEHSKTRGGMMKKIDNILNKVSSLFILCLLSSCSLASDVSGIELKLENLKGATVRVSIINNSDVRVYIPIVLSYEYYLKLNFGDGVKPLNLGIDRDRIVTDWDYIRLDPSMSISKKISVTEWYNLPYRKCYNVWATYHLLPIENDRLWDGIFESKVKFWSGKLTSDVIEICP